MENTEPSSFDLNLVPYIAPIIKTEPKPEPIEIPDPHPQSILSPNNNILSPEVHTPLNQLAPDEDALFAEYHRIAQLFLSSYNEKLGSNSGVVDSAGDGGSSSTNAIVAPIKKRKPRSGDMVRVSSIEAPDLTYFRDLVRRARITYESLRILLIRDEERALMLGLLNKRSRADLKAAALMTDRDLWLNRDRRIIGAIPGINIGDVYFFRMELCVIGLHGQVQAGIDYVTAARSSSGEPIATSIIVSGGYEDDDDKGYELIYTGHGGRDPNLHKHCVGQKLQGGNLALERSMVYGIEVRVVRGIKVRSDVSPNNKVYVYDGLYKIVNCWVAVGKSGFEVFKYKLIRIEGQEEMGSVMMKIAEELKVNPLSVRPNGYLSFDMAMGKENFPVFLFNDIDEERDPLLFEYVARPVYLESLKEKVFGDWAGGCECTGNCSIDCYCAKMNGGDLPYDANGILIRGKPIIYECGSSCKCPMACVNRVTQKGLRNRLEVFRSRETGWGVRSLDLIRAGSFICEFSGVILSKQQADELSLNRECLVCPDMFPSRWVEWGEVSDVFPDYVPPTQPSIPVPSFSIDVSRARNVACYMSHSSSPNVFVQFVLYDHYNVAFPHLMIFALENIPPLRELSIDYGMVEEQQVERLTM